MHDFTLSTYKALLQSLLKSDYKFQPFADFLKNPEAKAVILRHDVDALPGNSLNTAQLEHELDIRGTYYFRIVPESNQPDIIRAIAKLGHEIGYHYEDLALVGKGRWKRKDGRSKNANEILVKAIRSFEENLTYFRQFGPVNTICMHGSPLSRYDNRELWAHYNYRDFGIIGEPYFDIDFTKVLYLTDTGRRWDGERVSVRDKAGTPSFAKATAGKRDEGQGTKDKRQGTRDEGQGRVEGERGREKSFHSTRDIIAAAENRNLPNQLMITVHPQRWTNNPLLWTRELVWQNVKNVVKRNVRSKI